MSWFQVVCPDGNVRHYPYTQEGDAGSDARLCSTRGCRFYPKLSLLEKRHPPCPGGEHTVRPVQGPDPDALANAS